MNYAVFSSWSALILGVINIVFTTFVEIHQCRKRRQRERNGGITNRERRDLATVYAHPVSMTKGPR